MDGGSGTTVVNRTDNGLVGGCGSVCDCLRHLADQQQDFVLAELQHLRELAILNRSADALSRLRSVEQVLADTLAEARQITGTERLWLVYDLRGRPIAHGPAGPIDADALPPTVRRCCDRILAERTVEPVAIRQTSDTGEPVVHVVVSAATNDRITGVLVAEFADAAKADDRYMTRLLRSVLHQAASACENARLLRQLSNVIVDVVIAMAMAIESRDPYTGGHVVRVTAYSVMLGERLGLDPQDLLKLQLGGMLHDIGKVAVPDAVLSKPGHLDERELQIMRSHSAVGHEIIRPIPQLACISDIVRHHHERYDGMGYPDGLAGERIPHLARVVAIADSFDAMTSDRPYRKGMPVEDGLAEISRCAGTQFDPAYAGAFTDGPPDRFEAAVRRMRRWQEGQQRPDPARLIALLNANQVKPC